MKLNLKPPRQSARFGYFCAVRLSGGHLCEAEAPTEPAGEIGKVMPVRRGQYISLLVIDFLGKWWYSKGAT